MNKKIIVGVGIGIIVGIAITALVFSLFLVNQMATKPRKRIDLLATVAYRGDNQLMVSITNKHEFVVHDVIVNVGFKSKPTLTYKIKAISAYGFLEVATCDGWDDFLYAEAYGYRYE